MTIDYHITKFDSKILEQDLGYRIHNVQLDVHWVSCGFYVFSYPKFEFKPFPDSTSMRKVEGMSISVDPKWIDKIIELYPSVEKTTDRTKTFVPFFQVFDTDRGMFDFGQDSQFSAYKSQHDGWIVMLEHQANYGVPTRHVSSWSIHIDDLKALRDKLKDPSVVQPMWSGCKVRMS
jgi:hypothetical protein